MIADLNWRTVVKASRVAPAADLRRGPHGNHSRPAATVRRSDPGSANGIVSCNLDLERVQARAFLSPYREMGRTDDETLDGGPALRHERLQPLDLLYRSQAPGLRRRLRARLGSSEDANDLVHDAFARLAGAQPRGGLRDHAAFLNRIVRNLLIDRSRRLKTRAPHIALDDRLEIAVSADQADAFDLEQMRKRYRDAVALLPERMRLVFTLHRIEGLGYREIADRLDISVRTVEWHIAEAIVRITRTLDSE